MHTLGRRHPLPSLTQLGSPRGSQELTAEVKAWGLWQGVSRLPYCPRDGPPQCGEPIAQGPIRGRSATFRPPGAYGSAPSCCLCCILSPPLSSLLFLLLFLYLSPSFLAFYFYCPLPSQFPTNFSFSSRLPFLLLFTFLLLPLLLLQIPPFYSLPSVSFHLPLVPFIFYFLN